VARNLTIHFAGLKGVPATYGGVERAVEEIGARLASRGHEVVVHCRSHYTDEGLTRYRGMVLRREGSLRTKRLDTISHTLVSLLAAVRERPDVIGLHNYPNGPLAVIGRIARVPVVLHLHGFEWGLGKWNRFDKAILRLLLRPSTAAPAALTSVSRLQGELIRRETGREVLYIPNGVAPPGWLGDAAAVARSIAPLDLERDGYVLCVSRLVPQKGVEYLIRSYRSSPLDLPLVIVGDHNHAPEYAAMLRHEAAGDPRIRFAGYRFGDELWGLYSGCRLFVLPSESEGMPLVLLEAMAAGCAILATRLPEIEEVGRTTIAYFRSRDEDDLRKRTEEFLSDEGRRDELGRCARERVLATYSWDRIAEAYEQLYLDLLDRRARRG
jgi:glycosyltransferase involved in cell wall biosynthesis